MKALIEALGVAPGDEVTIIIRDAAASMQMGAPGVPPSMVLNIIGGAFQEVVDDEWLVLREMGGGVNAFQKSNIIQVGVPPQVATQDRPSILV